MSGDNEKELPAVPHQDNVEANIIEQVLEATFEDAQPLVARHLDALTPEQGGSELELFLRSIWEHLEGIRVVKEEGKFDLAGKLEESAAAGFQQLGIYELESMSRSMSAYANAVIEVQRLNINRSLELFAATEDYLRKAGRFGRKFQPTIDHMKPEALFIGVIPALLAGDIDSATALTSQAFAASEKVVKTYYETNDPLHFTFLGLAYFYRAIYSYFQAQADLTKLELDKLESEDLAASAREAERLLAQADLTNIQIQVAHHLAKALVDLLEVTKGIAAHIHLCFKATFKPDARGFADLRMMTRRAIENASRAGPQAVPVVRSCDDLLSRISNVERLARPRKTDFGIYSGLISARLFLPLLVIASWARSAFGFELDGKTFFLAIVGIALVGGFGFGALRFKNFLFSPAPSDG